jgi:hypothetical protein
MADDVISGAAVGTGPTFATDEIGNVHYPRSKVVWGADGTATDVSAAAPLPVVQTGTPALPTGAATEASIAAASAKLPAALGQATMAASLSVTVASNQTAVPVSAASLPLPSGAATAARQAIPGTAGTPSSEVLSVQGVSGGTALPMSAAALPLPSGASTEATLAAASAKLPATLGQKAMTASLPVVLASDQASVPVAATLQAETTKVIGTVNVAAGQTIAATNAGTFATQETGAALTALQALDDLVLTEDAPHVSGEKGLLPFAVRRDANTSLVGADGDLAPFQVTADGSLKVAITAGAGSGGTSATDDAAFTPGSGAATPIAGFADETTPDAVDEGDVGAVRMTLQRALHVNLRDASGAELTVGAQYAEDAVHADGNQVMMAGTRRADAPTTSAGADGDNAVLNTDADGRLWVSAGQAAHDAAVAGRPVRIGARAQSADWTAVTTGDQVDALASLLGKLVTLPYALPGATWRYAGAAGGLVNTTGVTVKAAAGAGIRNYVTNIQCMNSHQTTGTEIELRDGAAGTVLWRGWAQAVGGGFSVPFATPIRGTANTLLEIAEVTATGTAGVVCNLQGYEAGE